MNPIPNRFDRLFNIIVLDLNRYVEIMKPIVLIAAQTKTRDKTVHAKPSRVINPMRAIKAPKNSRLGIEISSGARAIPSA